MILTLRVIVNARRVAELLGAIASFSNVDEVFCFADRAREILRLPCGED